MRTRSSLAALCLCLSVAVPVSAPADTQAPLSRTEFVLWTTCTITLYDHQDPAILDACFTRLREIHARISVNVPSSEVDAVSAASGKSPVKVTDDILLVAQRALFFSQVSDGLFDPTVGPLIKVWKINKEHPDVPAQADIDAARALVNWHDLVLDPAKKTLFLKRAGMQLDLGGVAKGYAADEMVRILTERGVKSAIIDLGGNIYAMGNGRDGTAWRIGIQNPDAERGDPLGIARVVNKTVVTSGVYEHYFIKNGRRYHHIMDTRTGYPTENGVESATVISDKSVDADGLATTLICMGTKQGIALAEKLGVNVIMVDSDHKVYVTPDARKFFQITDPLFTFAQ